MNLMNHLTPEQLEKREYNKTKRQVDQSVLRDKMIRKGRVHVGDGVLPAPCRARRRRAKKTKLKWEEIYKKRADAELKKRNAVRSPRSPTSSLVQGS